MGNKGNQIMTWIIIIVCVVAAIVFSVAGVMSSGILGIFYGPIIVVVGLIIIGKIFS